MSVRPRTWTNKAGLQKRVWVVDYVDQHGKRHIQTFAKKKDAVGYQASVKVDIARGVHTPVSQSITVGKSQRCGSQPAKTMVSNARRQRRTGST